MQRQLAIGGVSIDTAGLGDWDGEASSFAVTLGTAQRSLSDRLPIAASPLLLPTRQ